MSSCAAASSVSCESSKYTDAYGPFELNSCRKRSACMILPVVRRSSLTSFGVPETDDANRLTGCPRHRKPFDAVDEGGVQSIRLLGRDEVGQLPVEFFEGDGDLAAGEVGAEAEVCASATEADMRIRMAANVEPPRIGELRLVSVGRSIPERDLVTRSHCDAAQFDIARGRATHVGHRPRPAHDFLDRRRRDRVVVVPPVVALLG